MKYMINKHNRINYMIMIKYYMNNNFILIKNSQKIIWPLLYYHIQNEL